MLATNARPTNTYSNDFQRNFAFGCWRSSPKMCDECCCSKSNMFLECLWPATCFTWFYVKIWVCIDDLKGRMHGVFFYETLVRFLSRFHLLHFFYNCVVENKFWWLLRNQIDQISGEIVIGSNIFPVPKPTLPTHTDGNWHGRMHVFYETLVRYLSPFHLEYLLFTA